MIVKLREKFLSVSIRCERYDERGMGACLCKSISAIGGKRSEVTSFKQAKKRRERQEMELESDEQ